ncbi:hypothetical protein RUM43_005079 [Polyplax serrata]|uniref:TsaA-like domain-containing protein n=1 Tax=Polyplax serrata TaxID=468196 RepID=A0AAN8XMI1_POLSC
MEKENNRVELINQLQRQLSIARSEIKNLRQQVINLKHTQKNDVDEIQNYLKSVKCQNCKNKSQASTNCECEYPNFQSIGTIESWFPEKRGIPRQGVLCSESQGVLTLFPSVVNNPSYALDGLEQFSHMWIIYHFHKTDANHIRTKVAPPKLNGERVGVFSTRSPHRPCPIGLSVVKIDRITENKVYFSGVDMLNGTPVLDIKPYIPHYDNPVLLGQQGDREVEGGVTEEGTPVLNLLVPDEGRSEGREAPDGEEDAQVKVPSWISNSANGKLKVEFTKRGLSQLNELSQSEQLKKAIVNIVEEDPRSVYLKQKLGNQFYTFLIKDVHVTCKFYDAKGVVVIHQLKEANQNCVCGKPEWQCGEHAK